MKTILGTKGYMAPEIENKKLYHGNAIDVFSAGVILFLLYSKLFSS